VSTTTAPATTPHGAAHGHGDDPDAPKTYALLAEYGTADDLVVATRKAAAAGYTLMDTHTPYPVGETADALGYPKSEMGAVMFIGGITGACAGFLMQYWNNAYGYSLNVGGRPYFSWPSFVPVTFEMMVLTAGLSGLFGLMALCGLPRLHHPLFNSANFDRATRDRFFLSVEAADPKFNLEETRAFLTTLNPLSVEEVME
jgi:hypothetical protein